MAQRSKREDIAAAAVEQFHARGYHATSVRDVTQAAGAPVGSFYNHFATKDDLALEAVQRYSSGTDPVLTDASVPPLQRLRRHFEAIRDQNVGRGFTRGCMLGNFTAEVVDHNPVIRAAVRQAFTAWADAIADVLTQARTEGSLRAGVDTRSAARFVINAWEGALLESRAYQCTDAFDNFFTVIFGVLLPSEEPPTSTD